MPKIALIKGATIESDEVIKAHLYEAGADSASGLVGEPRNKFPQDTLVIDFKGGVQRDPITGDDAGRIARELEIANVPVYWKRKNLS